MTVLIPELSEEDNQAALTRVSSYITDATGEITETLTDSPWGRRRLAYTIRSRNVDYRDGYYVVTHFSATPNSITDIERELKLDTNVMRYLIVMDDPLAGEKDTGQAPAEGTSESEDAREPAASTESTPAEATEAPATESSPAEVVETDPAPAAAEAEEAPATEQAQSDSDETIEAETEEAAGIVEGEENPAPADAPTESRED